MGDEDDHVPRLMAKTESHSGQLPLNSKKSSKYVSPAFSISWMIC